MSNKTFYGQKLNSPDECYTLHHVCPHCGICLMYCECPQVNELVDELSGLYNIPIPQPEPTRIQRKRTKGWRMPPNTVSVTRPGWLGNPFKVADEIGEHDAKKLFKEAGVNYE